MNPVFLILIAIVATYVLVRGTIWLFDLITHDGYGVRPAPRSHHDSSHDDLWRRAA